MMSEKFDYLVQQWGKYDVNIDANKQEIIDNCFKNYIEQINTENPTLTLEKYTNRKSPDNSSEECSYFCTFIENGGTKYYGFPSVGNANFFGIKMNENGQTYYISKSVNGINEVQNAEKTEAEVKFKDTLLPYLKKISQTVNDTNKAEIFEAVEKENKIPSRVMLRKIVAMKNQGKFLFIYSDDAINTIYDFFLQEDRSKTNIEKNYEVTEKLKDIFPKKNNKGESDNNYLIRLSRFIWEIFGSSIKLEAKNMILHGAPGTGKTYSIKNTVKNIILKQGGDLGRQLVFTQFHPSYSYEDFIDGIKPNGIDEKTGHLKFELKNGNFKELCKIATQKLLEERKNKKTDDKLTKFFFVADEINRAELSRVFGELLICLEDDYRVDFDEQGNILKEESLITLQNASLDKDPVYKKGDKKYFGVPVNLYFIGTMNDIDRSVDSFDMALRRRFFWKEIRCNYDFINTKFNDPKYTTACKNLNRYITGYKEEKSNGRLEKIDNVNGKEPLRLGTSYELGHAYFKDIQSISNKGIEALWSSKIEPLLKEYLRAEYSQDEIYNKLQEAKEIFTLKDTDDTDS